MKKEVQKKVSENGFYDQNKISVRVAFSTSIKHRGHYLYIWNQLRTPRGTIWTL